MCSLSCSSSSSLQEHVELHLEYGSASVTGHSSEDLTMARKLQEEEEQKWREAATRREVEDFKQLQKQFGLDNSGGSRKQMERNMERAVSRGQMVPAEFHRKKAEMLESLASGVDDGGSTTSVSVPSIPRVQAFIEESWDQGTDPQGASHFNHRLQGTRAWIGATEIYVVLNSLSVKSRIVDFHKPTSQAHTHPILFEWVKQHFSHSASRGARLTPKIVQTTLPPIYLQHQGHSRSIVGVEQKVNGNLCLLLFDPGCAPREMSKVLSQDTAATMVRCMRKFPGSLKHRQYQVVAVEGLLTPEEKQSCILNSRTLCAEKIS
ncbi:zinc finger-containing ubiquitin peptidase 1-like isoform X2 [Carassius carassius]|uniref:zinc finger-containing ubiquitin peptidase 1-like isoform X2 n=1 Tax=Carassius carassius TaxID=217509 RepID=UPI002868A5A0|nr:zinc finger-containing ubiquitin peptidase 1-like isoform X2 [Carassius carassius]